MEDILETLGVDKVEEPPTSNAPASNYSKPNNYNNNYNNGYNNQNNYKNNNYNGKSKGVNMYEVDFIKSAEIDTDKFSKDGHSFMVHVFEGQEEEPGLREKFEKLVKALSKKGYVYRCDAGSNDEIANSLTTLEDVKVEAYLPFKKFNEDLADEATLVNKYELPFKYAAGIYGQKFNERKPGARAVFAAKVMAALGKDCDNPVDFLLCYSPSGTEFFDHKVKPDYSKVGTLSFYIRLAQKAGIPVFNIKNKSSIENLIDTYIKKPSTEVEEPNTVEA